MVERGLVVVGSGPGGLAAVTAFREHDRRVRDALMDGRRHVYEAEMKQERRTHGREGHEATPGDV